MGTDQDSSITTCGFVIRTWLLSHNTVTVHVSLQVFLYSNWSSCCWYRL